MIETAVNDQRIKQSVNAHAVWSAELKALCVMSATARGTQTHAAGQTRLPGWSCVIYSETARRAGGRKRA